MERRIIKVPDGIIWEDFREKFWKFFPISHEPKRIEKLKAEFERLTGRKADDGKAKGTERQAGKVEPGSDGAKGRESGKGSRNRGDKSEHGSALRGEGLGGEEPAGV